MTRKTLIITGTNSGLGKSSVELFHERGWNVVATMRQVPESSSNPFEKLERVRILPLELTDPASIEALPERARAAFGRVDALVNNAGYFQMGPLETSSMDQVRRQFETNVFGLIHLTQLMIPLLASTRGSIVNLSSISAENGFPFASAYSASKAAVMALTEALNIELADQGIAVKAVPPGTHATRIFTKIDGASSVPPPYQRLLALFLSLQQSSGGSEPRVAAEAIYAACTDERPDKVRYFAGPDAISIPVAKRLLGAERYFRNFRRSLLEGPGPLARLLAPRLSAKVDVDRKLLDGWQNS